MARMIDADKLKTAIRAESWKQERKVQLTLDFIDIIISEQPSVDAVEVVRCRDCTYWGDEDGKLQGSDGVLFARCKAHNYLIDGRHTGWCPSENDFCSYGERNGGDADA